MKSTLMPAVSAASRTPLQEFWHHFKRNRPAVIGSIMVAILAVCAISAAIFTREGGSFDPNKTELAAQLRPPAFAPVIAEIEEVLPDGQIHKENRDFGTHVLGTDDVGHDVLVRLWSGSRISLLVGIISMGISVILGILVGGIAGFYGRGKIRLPFLLCVLGWPLGELVSTFDFMGGTAHTLGSALMWMSVALLLFHVALVIHARDWATLIVFGIVASLAGSVVLYSRQVEHHGPYGEWLQSHAIVADKSEDTRIALVRAIRDRQEYEDLVTSAGNTKDDGAVSAAKERALQSQFTYFRIAAELTWLKGTAEVKKNAAAVYSEERALGDSRRRASDESVPANDRIIAQNAAAASERKLATLTKERDKAIVSEAERKTALDDALQMNTLEDKNFKGANDLRTQNVRLKQEKNTYYLSGQKDAIKAMTKASPLYELCRNVVLLIFVGFVAVVAFLLLAKSAQEHGVGLPGLRRMFIPILTIDNFIMRFIEILITMPQFMLLLTILAFYDRTVWLVMFIIGITSWMGTARFVRAEVLSLRERDFVQAARALGLRDFGVILKHLVPNAISPVLVSATLGVAGAILTESTLSFLGVGAGPTEVTWGKMLQEGRQYITSAWWLTVIPGIAILIVVLSFNLLGEGMREALNPKLRKR